MHQVYNIAIIFLYFVPCVYAMDLEIVQKRENCFDKLPLELHGKVIKNIFSLIIREDEQVEICIDQKKLKKYRLQHVQILLGIEYAQQYYLVQKACQNKIGDKTFLAPELFVLPREQRDVFIRIANRGFFVSVSEGDLSGDDYKILEAMKNENTKKGLTLRLLEGNKITSYTRATGAGGIYLSFLLVWGSIIFKSKNRYLRYLICGSWLSSISLFGMSIVLEKCGYPACIIKKQF